MIAKRKPDTRTISEIVDAIQEQIDSMFIVNETFYIEYTKSSWIEFITFNVLINDIKLKVDLWHSETESREWIEELNDYELMEEYLIRSIQKIINQLSKFNTTFQSKFNFNKEAKIPIKQEFFTSQSIWQEKKQGVVLVNHKDDIKPLLKILIKQDPDWKNYEKLIQVAPLEIEDDLDIMNLCSFTGKTMILDLYKVKQDFGKDFIIFQYDQDSMYL